MCAVRLKVPAGDEAKEAKQQRQRAEREKVHLSFKRVWMEWLLLQCVCDQARRELMESVYLYLSKT